MDSCIKKIVLNIGKKTIELSLDEAKELKGLLGDMFNSATVINYPSPTLVPTNPFPYRPYWNDVIYGKSTITCSTTNI